MIEKVSYINKNKDVSCDLKKNKNKFNRYSAKQGISNKAIVSDGIINSIRNIQN